MRISLMQSEPLKPETVAMMERNRGKWEGPEEFRAFMLEWIAKADEIPLQELRTMLMVLHDLHTTGIDGHALTKQ